MFADEGENTVAFQFTLDQDELDQLLQTDNHNQVIYDRFVKELDSIAHDWYFTTKKES